MTFRLFNMSAALNAWVFVVALLLSACGTESPPIASAGGTQEADVAELRARGVWQVPLGARTINHTPCLMPLRQDSTRYLAYLNEHTNAIHFYDLDERALAHRVPYQREGPEGISEIRDFQVVSFDTIFLGSRNQPVVYLADTAGRVTNRYDYRQTVSGHDLNYHGSGNLLGVKHMIYRDGKLYLVQRSNSSRHEWYFETEKAIEKRPIEISIRLADGRVEALPARYPRLFLEEGKKFSAFSRASGPDGFVYAFCVGSHVYVQPPGETQVRKYYAGSRYFSDEETLFTTVDNTGDMATFNRALAADPWYRGLYHDPYRRVYYRFAKLAQDISAQDDRVQYLIERELKPSEASVIILDESFNKIGETRLPSGRHIIDNAFVEQEGLYISNSHPDNPALHDDTLAFTIYELVRP